MTSHRERLVRLVAEARDPLGLRRQVDFVKASGLSKSTVHRFERGEAVDAESLRIISETVGWTADSAKLVLAGGDPAPAPVEHGPSQWQRGPAGPDDLAQLIRNVVFEAVIAAAPDTSASQIRQIENRALEMARKAGYGPRHQRQDTHTQDEPES